MSCAWRGPESVTGTLTPTLSRMCCRVLREIWSSGTAHFARGAENRAAAAVAGQHALVGDGQVAQPALPAPLRAVVGGQRDDQFQLVPGPEPFLVDDFAADAARTLQGHRGHHQQFVLGEGLFRDQGLREVELPRRPGPFLAEGADMVQDKPDLRLGQSLAEGGHGAVESPGGAALVDDRRPIRVGLAGSELAIGEIGQPHGQCPPPNPRRARGERIGNR